MQALQAVGAHLQAAADQPMDQGPALDLLAEELRLAQNALSDITGEFSSDDLLGVIFSSFCIGKCSARPRCADRRSSPML